MMSAPAHPHVRNKPPPVRLKATLFTFSERKRAFSSKQIALRFPERAFSSTLDINISPCSLRFPHHAKDLRSQTHLRPHKHTEKAVFRPTANHWTGWRRCTRIPLRRSRGGIPAATRRRCWPSGRSRCSSTAPVSRSSTPRGTWFSGSTTTWPGTGARSFWWTPPENRLWRSVER